MAMLCRRARDSSLVVVKELFQHDALSDEDRRQSMNEIQVLSLLRHPNVIAYYDSFTADAAVVNAGGGTDDGSTVPPAGDDSPAVGRNQHIGSSLQQDLEKSIEQDSASDLVPQSLVPHYQGSLMIVMEYADGASDIQRI